MGESFNVPFHDSRVNGVSGSGFVGYILENFGTHSILSDHFQRGREAHPLQKSHPDPWGFLTVPPADQRSARAEYDSGSYPVWNLSRW